MANVVDVYTNMFIKNGSANMLDLHQKRKKNLSVSIRCMLVCYLVIWLYNVSKPLRRE